MNRIIAYSLLLIAIIFAVWYSTTHVDAPSLFDDDTQYMQNALAFSTGHFTQGTGNILSLRLMMSIPMAVSYLVLGYTPLASAMWDIVSFIGSIIVAFLIGRELFDEYVGAAAALLLAFIPQVALLATSADDAIPLMFLSALVMLCLTAGRKRNYWQAYLLAGALLVADMLVSPLGFIMLLLATAYVAWDYFFSKKIPLTCAAWFLAGIAIAGIVLTAFNYYTSMDPVITLKGYAGFYSTYKNIGIALNFDPSFYFWVLFNFSSPGNGGYGPGSFYILALIPSIAYIAWRRKRHAEIPIIWFGFVLTYIAIGPMSITLNPLAYYLIPGVWRYVSLIAVPMALLIAIALVGAMRELLKLYRSGKAYVMLALVALLALVAMLILDSFGNVLILYHGDISLLANSRELGAYLSVLPSNSMIYISAAMPYALTFASLYSNARIGISDVRLISSTPTCTSVANASYVVLPESWAKSADVSSSYASPCINWTEAFSISGYATVYYTGSAARPK